MKKQFSLFLFALVIPVFGFSQIKTSEYANTGDTIQRIITNRNALGISKLGLFTGNNAVWFRAEDKSLSIIADSLFYYGIALYDTNQIKEVDTATDLYDVVPFFQIMDSVNAASISNIIKFDTIIDDTIAIFTSIVSLDTNRIIKLDTAVDPYDAVPFWQMLDSIYANGGGGGSSNWVKAGNYLFPLSLTDSIGVGTNTPDEVLSVVGHLGLKSATGHEIVIGYNVAPNMSAILANYNLLIGERVGYELTTGNYNVAIGYEAFGGAATAAITGNNNFALGYKSLYVNTSGFGNVGVGSQTLYSNITGRSNIAIGRDALGANIDGNFNVAVGESSSISNVSGDYNTAMGYLSYNSGTGNYNTALGYYTLRQATGQKNVAVGGRAGYTTGSGSYNTFGGYEAGNDNYTGNNNAYFGYVAGHEGVHVSDNAALGYGAGYANKYGHSNVSIGKQACYLGDTVVGCVSIGFKAGYYGDSEYNTFIGYQTGYDNKTGNRNIAIGYDVEVGVAVSDTLNIGNVIQANLTDGIVYLNDIVNLVPRSSVPTSAVLGMLYSNSTDMHLYYYNGNAWVQLD